MKVIHYIAFTLLVIGGLNWGLVALFDFNLVAKIFGMGIAADVVYVLVALSAIWEAATHGKTCKMCGSQATMTTPTL